MSALGGLEPLGLLGLLRFVSPGLPIGAYAYSRGLEQAVFSGAVCDEATAADWILGLLSHLSARVDGPVFLRLYEALERGDEAAFERWNALLLATRESAELRLEDTQLGAALARLLVGQAMATQRARALMERDDVCYASTFALAALSAQVPLSAALLGFLWVQAEGQISAAVRLIPLGQTAGQRLISRLSALLPACADQARSLADTEIGALSPGLALASALHETQYTRLFRS
jgi:urease accessory protein